MARPKTPIEIHKARGTLRAARKRESVNELQFSATGVGEPPEWFDAEQVAEWKRVTEHPELKRVLAPAHVPIVIHHCILFQRMVQDAKGERVMTASERQTFHSIQMQLGWTPASQAKVHVPQPAETNDPWAALG